MGPAGGPRALDADYPGGRSAPGQLENNFGGLGFQGEVWEQSASCGLLQAGMGLPGRFWGERKGPKTARGKMPLFGGAEVGGASQQDFAPPPGQSEGGSALPGTTRSGRSCCWGGPESEEVGAEPGGLSQKRSCDW